MREMKDSGVPWIGEIPEDWVLKPLFSFLDRSTNAIVDGPFGSDLKNEEYVDWGVPIIQLGAIKEKGLDFSKIHYITSKKADCLCRHNAFPGDIVIAKMMPAGKSCELPNSFERYVVSADVIKASISDKDVRKFLIYALNSYSVVQAEYESQGSTRSRVNIDKVKHFKFVFPNNETHRRIVRILDSKCAEIDALCADIQAEIDALEEYKRSIITETVTKGLDPDAKMKDSGIPWIGEIPEDWSVVPIRAVFEEVTTKNELLKIKKALMFTYGEIVPKTDFDADSDQYVQETIRKYLIVHPGTIMLNGLNLNFDFITQRIGLVKDLGVITSAYMAFRPIDQNVITSEFAIYLLKTYDGCKAFHNMGGGVRKILNFSELKKQYVVFPNIGEQKRIVEYIERTKSEIMAAITEKRESISTLSEYKKSLIYEYVTGKKEVPYE